MLLVSAVHLVRQFDRAPVLNRVSFELHLGERVGLVGPNGAGKTTLLRLLAGQDQPDSGEVVFPSGTTFGLLAQQPDFAPGRTLREEAAAGLDDILALQREAAALAEQIAQASDPDQQARLARRYDTVQHQLQHRGGFQIDYRIDEVLAGLGFERQQYDQPLAQLSGGQQNRVLLARLLLQSPDVLLLDEPTNHLDIAATEWLERYLVDSGRTLLLVSHDRYFLDRVCTRIFELHAGRLTDYPGNFTHYWRLREERQLAAQRAYEKQQEFIARAEDYIRRNKSGQNAARAKDREHKLARLEAVETIPDIPTPPMAFAPPSRTGDWVIDAVELSKSYHTPLFEHLSLRIQRGERWGLLGPNGCGKTTLLRILLGEIPPDTGTVRLGTNVRIGYFDQQLGSVDPEATALEAVRPPDVARFTDGQLRDLLARFGVQGDLALQRVAAMSGGERSKVALARLAALEPNLLVLDEPTNHLDLWSRAALERALRDFTGTVLFVSHDRYFLDRVATHILAYEQQRWWEFPGSYTAFTEFCRQRTAERQAAAPARPAPAPVAPKELRRRRKFPYRKVADLEAEIAEKEGLLRRCEADLANPEIHRDHARWQQVMRDYEQVQARLSTLYEHWEEAVELN
jgi:ATP-binding cassette subfamily F protein 3